MLQVNPTELRLYIDSNAGKLHAILLYDHIIFLAGRQPILTTNYTMMQDNDNTTCVSHNDLQSTIKTIPLATITNVTTKMLTVQFLHNEFNNTNICDDINDVIFTSISTTNGCKSFRNCIKTWACHERRICEYKCVCDESCDIWIFTAKDGYGNNWEICELRV